MCNKVILITGGNRCFGLAIARAFVASGAKVAVAGRDLVRCEEAVRGLASSPGTAMAVCLDVTDPPSVEAAISNVVERFDGLDILINNAALVGPLSVYCCSKAGLAMLTKCLAEEYGSAGLRSFGFRPGMLNTEMLAEVRAANITEVSKVDPSLANSPDIPAAVLLQLCA